MVTRFHVRTNRLSQRLTLHVSSIFPLRKSYSDVFNDPNWQNAMTDEYNALIKNNTWTLMPRPTYVNIVRCMWLFRYKYLANDTLSHYKTRLVANDNTHVEGIDADETFSLVVKPGTIKTVLSLAVFRHWPAHQLDVKNAFLHSDLSEKSDTESKLGDDGDPVSDPTLYRSLACSLQYLTFTRPDISYAVQHVCLYIHDPREPHFLALKRILRYVRGYCVFLRNNLLSWSSKRQPTLALSSADAEYRGVANAVV
ncbi:ribonuclease H-like domain-containing protein, partial [Tanacetum coccineum]